MAPVQKGDLRFSRFHLKNPSSIFKWVTQDWTDLVHSQSDLGDDLDWVKLIGEEATHLREKISQKELDILSVMLPEDPLDRGAAILECRAGTGGDEASLFALDVMRMYERYASGKGWNFEVLHMNTESNYKGIKVT